MKIFHLFLLSVLISPACIFAQDKNRLEETNQVTGCRLQVAGSKTTELPLGNQIRQRSNTTTNYNNQVIGCRLQVVGVNQAADQAVGRRRTELPLEDQIRQRTETTTNCELRTTNCDNSSLDLSYHLSMDPTELKSIEAGVEALGEELEIVRRGATPPRVPIGTISATHFSVESSYLSDASTWSLKSEEALERANQMQGEEGDLWRDVAKQYQIAIDYKRKALEAHVAGNEMLAAGYKDAAETSQKAAELWKQSAQTSGAGKESERTCWFNTGKYIQAKAGYQIKVCVAQEAGKTAFAEGYRETVETCQRAADQCRQAALAFAKGNEKEGISLGWEGTSLYAKADCQAKAIEAREAGKVIQAADYTEAAATCQRAADQWEQVAQAVTSGKESEGISWAEAGLSFVQQSECHKKAIEAQEAGNEALAAGYRKVIEISQRAGEYHQQAAEAFALEKEGEGGSWTNVGKFLQSKADDQIKAAEKIDSNPFLSSSISHLPSAIAAAASPTSHLPPPTSLRLPSSSAAAVPLTSHLPPPTIIRPVGRIMMALSIYCKKWLTETKSAEGPVKILSDYIIDVVRRGADHELVKDFEKYWSYVAKNHELGDDSQALAWIQVAEDIQQAIEDSIKKAEATKSRNWKLSNAWNNTVQAVQKVAKYRELYIQTSMFSQAPEIVSKWKKVVEQAESIADYSRKTAEACSLGKIAECNRCNSAANSMKKKLEETVTALEKKESSA